MSRDEYWNGDILAPLDYIEADNIRRKRANEDAWLQGLYFYDALSTVVANATRQKGAPLQQYTANPYDIFPKSEREKTISSENEALLARVWMEQFVNAYKK